MSKFCWLFLIHFCQCSAVNCVVFLTVWVNFPGFYIVTVSNFPSFSVDCLCLEFVGCPSVGQNNLLALLPLSHLLLAFYCVYCLFSLY